MCCAQPRELEPADDVLESHLLERLSQGIVDGILVPRRDRAEVRLDLRPESLDRRVVRAVGRQGQEPGTRPPDGRRGGISLMGDRLSHTTTSPACSSGTSTCSTYDSNAAVSVDPGNTSGARTPSSPSAAITVSDSHEGGRADGPLAARGPAVRPGHRRGHPRLVHENKPFRLDPLHLPPEGPPLLPSGKEPPTFWHPGNVGGPFCRGICHPPSGICHPPSGIRHLPSAIRHPPFLIPHSPFPIPKSTFRIFQRGG